MTILVIGISIIVVFVGTVWILDSFWKKGYQRGYEIGYNKGLKEIH